jgi:hypothetical protein
MTETECWALANACIKKSIKRALTVDDNSSQVEEAARDLVWVLYRRSLPSQ